METLYAIFQRLTFTKIELLLALLMGVSFFYLCRSLRCSGNWGVPARNAARQACQAFVDFVSSNQDTVYNTRELLYLMLNAFTVAHYKVTSFCFFGA